MLALIRYFSGLLKKEHILRNNYHRAHPHFVWYVLIDAMLSIALVFGGFSVAHALLGPNKAQIEKEDAGAIALTSEQLFSHFQGEKRVAYWMGPKEGYAYSPNGVEKNLVTITYLQGEGSSLSDVKGPKLTIQTFDNESAFEAHSHGFASPERTKTWNSRGDEVIYDSQFMTSAVVKVKNEDQMVQINYPSVRSPIDIITDSMALHRVW